MSLRSLTTNGAKSTSRALLESWMLSILRLAITECV